VQQAASIWLWPALHGLACIIGLFRFRAGMKSALIIQCLSARALQLRFQGIASFPVMLGCSTWHGTRRAPACSDALRPVYLVTGCASSYFTPNGTGHRYLLDMASLGYLLPESPRSLMAVRGSSCHWAGVTQ
jgi:hypothetical protein